MPSKVKAILNYGLSTCYVCHIKIKHTITFVFRKRESSEEIKICKKCHDNQLHILLF